MDVQICNMQSLNGMEEPWIPSALWQKSDIKYHIFYSIYVKCLEKQTQRLEVVWGQAEEGKGMPMKDQKCFSCGYWKYWGLDSDDVCTIFGMY